MQVTNPVNNIKTKTMPKTSPSIDQLGDLIVKEAKNAIKRGNEELGQALLATGEKVSKAAAEVAECMHHQQKQLDDQLLILKAIAEHLKLPDAAIIAVPDSPPRGANGSKAILTVNISPQLETFLGLSTKKYIRMFGITALKSSTSAEDDHALSEWASFCGEKIVDPDIGDEWAALSSDQRRAVFHKLLEEASQKTGTSPSVSSQDDSHSMVLDSSLSPPSMAHASTRAKAIQDPFHRFVSGMTGNDLNTPTSSKPAPSPNTLSKIESPSFYSRGSHSRSVSAATIKMLIHRPNVEDHRVHFSEDANGN